MGADGGLRQVEQNDHPDGEHGQGVNAENPANQEGSSAGFALQRAHQDQCGVHEKKQHAQTAERDEAHVKVRAELVKKRE